MDKTEDFYPAARKIIITSFILSMGAAVILTFLDWQKNPGGIFYSVGSTDWSVVWATFASWVVPLFFVLIAVLGLAVYIVYLIKNKKSQKDVN